MPARTPTPLITVDISKKPWEQEKPLHNRWHPDIPAVSDQHRQLATVHPLLAIVQGSLPCHLHVTTGW